MAKDQNHTNHNQGFKLHRNGIKKPKKVFKRSNKGIDRRLVRNWRYATKGNVKALKEKKQAAKKAAAAKVEAPK